VILLQPQSVQLVGDTGNIPSGFPRPYLPLPIFDVDLILSGLAVAIIGLIQGAGISSAYPNPDGKYPDVSRDFLGQGIANVVVSLFRGVPVGGSMSSTVLIVSSGATSRWANIFTGLFAIMAVFFLKGLRII
jgi:SulP family sulfate permease